MNRYFSLIHKYSTTVTSVALSVLECRLIVKSMNIGAGVNVKYCMQCKNTAKNIKLQQRYLRVHCSRKIMSFV